MDLPMPSPSAPTIVIGDTNWGIPDLSRAFDLNSQLLQEQLTIALKKLQGTGGSNPAVLAEYQALLGAYNTNKQAQAKTNETVKDIDLVFVRAF